MEVEISDLGRLLPIPCWLLVWNYSSGAPIARSRGQPQAPPPFQGKLVLSLTNPQQANVLLDPTEDLQSRALQWFRQQPAGGHLPVTKKLVSLFPNGPRLSDDQLDVADAQGMFYSVIKSYITDFVSVLEKA